MSNSKNPRVDGESLKARRKQIKMSVQELSIETGLATSFIRQLEKGDAEADADTLSKLANTLGMKPEELTAEE